MSFSVMTGGGGYAGWKLLNRTMSSQRSAIESEASIQREKTRLESSLPKAVTADDLLGDFQTLKVVLTAFGLEGDINNRFFLKKVIGSDLSDSKSLANKLSDKRYRQLAQALDLGGEGGEGTKMSARDLFQRYVSTVLEVRVGDQDGNLRLALSAERELPDVIKANEGNTDAFWYSILGSKSLRAVFDTAFGMPRSFGRIPIDRQLAIYKNNATKIFGSSEPELLNRDGNVDNLIRRFLLRSQVAAGPSLTKFSSALTLLRS